MSSNQKLITAQSELHDKQLEQVSGGWSINWVPTAPAPQLSKGDIVVTKSFDKSSPL